MSAKLPPVTLIVRSGLHAGACLELSQPAYVIGSDADCDVVLRDPGIEPRHCRLIRTALGVSLWDIRPGTTHVMRPIAAEPAQSIYQIGDAQIALCKRETEEQVVTPALAALRKRSPAQVATAGLLIVLVLTTLVIAAADQFAAHLRPELAERLVQGDAALRAQGFKTVHFRTLKQKELEIAGTVPNAAAKNRLRQWIAAGSYKDARFKVHTADSLAQQVRDALGDTSVQARFDRGRLLLEGTTSRIATRQRIRSVTEDLQGVIAIDDRVAYIEAPEAAGPLPVRVRDVKVGDARYFSADNGARYFEGALLPDGAEVIAIDATEIRFRRGGRTLVYELNGGIALD
jgi:hypothetical protein